MGGCSGAAPSSSGARRGADECDSLPTSSGIQAPGANWLRDYVFATAQGKPLSQRNVTRDLGKAAERAGLTKDEKLTTHDLRHTAISRWIAAGLDPVTVARMAGDKVETILSTYAHEFDKANRRDEVREKLAAATRITV